MAVFPFLQFILPLLFNSSSNGMLKEYFYQFPDNDFHVCFPLLSLGLCKVLSIFLVLGRYIIISKPDKYVTDLFQLFFFLRLSDNSFIIPIFWAHYLNITFSITLFFSCYQLEWPGQTLFSVILVIEKCLVSAPSLHSKTKIVLQVALLPQNYHVLHLYVCNVKTHALKCQFVLSPASVSIFCLYSEALFSLRSAL